jgi:hypothetical protein
VSALQHLFRRRNKSNAPQHLYHEGLTIILALIEKGADIHDIYHHLAWLAMAQSRDQPKWVTWFFSNLTALSLPSLTALFLSPFSYVLGSYR